MSLLTKQFKSREIKAIKKKNKTKLDTASA